MRRYLLPLLAAVAMLCAGCATDQRNQSLVTTLNAYASALRWGDFQNARQFVDPKVRDSSPLTPLDLARYRQVRVVGYDEGAGPVPDGELQVRQVVQIGLVNINTQAERTVTDRQTWRFDPEKKRWWLTSGLPDITRE
ncbi:hypothetical protein [Frateuria sp. STR12]|uniref:hypothetical protein n=1 Tax=Frateuria hangzhouensis TaxID=2995589 RepID=UPI002260E6A0|nr:hypothetical protein [Frateuria sp. STR12]MCX7514502.1 hypothetical protein [Frateuria sp. STR12]